MSRIAITDYFEEPGPEELEVLGDLVGMDVDEDTEVLMVWHQKIDEYYVSRLPNLRAVQRYGVGYDNLDITYLNSKGIKCCNNPDYGVDEVSDTAVAFIMCINRGVIRYNELAMSLSDTWQENVLSDLKRNNEVTVGVIGAGRIGSSVLLKCKSIGFKTMFYDPYKDSGYDKVLGATRAASLDQLLESSDIVSIHCPLTNETRGMIDKTFLNKMKIGASLVNTARGQILDNPDDVLDALRENKLMNAAFDVLPDEPPGKEHLFKEWREQPAWIKGRLLINPHTSYYSQTSFKEIRRKAAENALRLFKGSGAMNILKDE